MAIVAVDTMSHILNILGICLVAFGIMALAFSSFENSFEEAFRETDDGQSKMQEAKAKIDSPAGSFIIDDISSKDAVRLVSGAIMLSFAVVVLRMAKK